MDAGTLGYGWTHGYEWRLSVSNGSDRVVVRSAGEGIDNLLAVKIGGNVYYPLTDIQGTVWGYADYSGDVVARWTYDVWGNVLSESCAVPSLASVRYRFQGREWSTVTGLIHFRMRWYDPGTGRWLSKDPIGLGGGFNLYVFCANSPLVCIDPDGGKSLLGQIWNSPNSVIGMFMGGIGSMVSGALGKHPGMKDGNNAKQFLNNGLSPFGAITLGNVILYGPCVSPDEKCPEGTYGDHERQHTEQGEILGPFYFPLHIISGLTGLIFNWDWHGPLNFLEIGPQSIPPRPWPWE